MTRGGPDSCCQTSLTFALAPSKRRSTISPVEGAYVHAGGTDLLGCARDEVFEVEKLVSISRLEELKGITQVQ